MDKNAELECFESAKKSFLFEYEELNKVLKLKFCNANKDDIAFILRFAYRNSPKDKFPDFVFKNGFIEHFEITSTKEDKKGSLERINQANFDKRNDEEIKELAKDSYLKKANAETIITKAYERTSEGCTYENLLKSFKANWLKHINNIEKSKYEYKTGVFLIESCGALPFATINNKFSFHGIYLNINMLEFIKEFKGKIKYIIHKYGDMYEIIDVDKIDEIINDCPRKVEWAMGRNKVKSCYFIGTYFPFIGFK